MRYTAAAPVTAPLGIYIHIPFCKRKCDYCDFYSIPGDDRKLMDQLGEKHQVIAMVTSILKLKSPPKPDDTADAVAIAICHSQCRGSAIGKYFNQRT